MQSRRWMQWMQCENDAESREKETDVSMCCEHAEEFASHGEWDVGMMEKLTARSTVRDLIRVIRDCRGGC